MDKRSLCMLIICINLCLVIWLVSVQQSPMLEAEIIADFSGSGGSSSTAQPPTSAKSGLRRSRSQPNQIHQPSRSPSNSNDSSLVSNTFDNHPMGTPPTLASQTPTPPQSSMHLMATLCANPDNVEAIGLMTVLCGQEGGCEQDSADMDYLFAKVTSEVKYTASHWFAHAQLLYDEGKFERGLNFVDQCLDSEPRNHEALILRGRLLIALERHTQAVCAFRTAQMVAPYRFEIYRGLFHSYLAQKRFKEANALCNWTIRLFQNSPRSFTMFGRTLFLFPDPRMRRTARKFAEKSLKINHIYTPAVNLIADICQVEVPTKATIKLLEKHVVIFPKVNLLNHLGDIMRKQKEPVKAMEYYYKALRQDPKSKRTLRGLRLLSKSFEESPVLDESDAIGMENQPSTNELATPCEGMNGAEGAESAENSREASSSAAARSGQEEDVDDHDWIDVPDGM